MVLYAQLESAAPTKEDFKEGQWEQGE